jgi:hypothetical protein
MRDPSGTNYSKPAVFLFGVRLRDRTPLGTFVPPLCSNSFLSLHIGGVLHTHAIVHVVPTIATMGNINLKSHTKLTKLNWTDNT